jgi:methyl-accepting chemotaxis protein
MMKVKYKAPLWILSITLLSTAFLVYSNYHSNERLIERSKTAELKLVATLIQNDIIEQGNNASAKVALMTDRPAIKEAFRAQDREQLSQLTLPSFQTLKNKYGVREAQFNLPPATVLLRLHNPSLYGDDDSSFRDMILLAVKNKRGYQGIEIGRSGVSIRAIDIIEDDKGVIGTFEVGMSFGTILEDIKKNINFDVAVFVNDALMTKIATTRPRAGPERIFGDLQGIGATDWSKILPYINTDLLSKVNDVTLLTKRINGKDYGIVLVPLLDFKNTEIGVIVAASDYSNYQKDLWNNLVRSITLALIQLVIITGAVMITFQTLLLSPIKSINKILKSWKEGKTDLPVQNRGEETNAPATETQVPIDVLTERTDEIGQLASGIDTLYKEKNDLNKKVEELTNTIKNQGQTPNDSNKKA